MDITPASIRDVSFALAPTGCNPAQVEEALTTIAEHLEAGEPVPARLFDLEFETVSAGFSPDEVVSFFDGLRQTLLGSSGTVTPLAPEELDDDGSQEPATADVSTAADALAADERTQTPPVAAVSRRTAAAPAAGSLPSAVERTKLAVSELETFVIHQMEEAKAALRLQIDQTQTDCQNTLDTARTISDQALDTARQRAEVLLDGATRTTSQLRERFDNELAGMRAAFEEELGRRHAAIQADLEALVTEAHTLTEEAHARLAEVHDDVRASLEDARTVLVHPARRRAA